MTNFFITIWLHNHSAVVQDLSYVLSPYLIVPYKLSPCVCQCLVFGKTLAMNEMVAISNLTYLDVVHFLPLGIACMFNVVQYKLLYEEQ